MIARRRGELAGLEALGIAQRKLASFLFEMFKGDANAWTVTFYPQAAFPLRCRHLGAIRSHPDKLARPEGMPPRRGERWHRVSPKSAACRLRTDRGIFEENSDGVRRPSSFHQSTGAANWIRTLRWRPRPGLLQSGCRADGDTAPRLMDARNAVDLHRPVPDHEEVNEEARHQVRHANPGPESSDVDTVVGTCTSAFRSLP